MSLITRRDSNGSATAPYRARDPFAVARELLNWDPFSYGSRQVVNFAPAFEVKESADAYLVAADLPGVKEEDVDISLHNGVLSISGSRRAEERKEGEAFYVYERQYGTFTRSFALPDEADADKVEARFADGVLSVRIGKRAEAKPRRIELKK
jgi:HSP20 family protein